MRLPVVLGGTGSPALTALAGRALGIGDDVAQALRLVSEIGSAVAHPGGGRTFQRWQTLATLGAADLTVARVAEPHLDALSIVAEADLAGIKVDIGAVGADSRSTWGVFAAEGPGVKLTATLDADGWSLSGVKPWCSLAGQLSHALITAHTPDGRALFAVSLRDTDIDVDAGAWAARGLTNVRSGPITLRRVPAVPVGPPLWYLNRPGFAWGGIGVAAVWLGGAIGIARPLFAQCRSKPDEPLRLMQLGAVDTLLTVAAGALVDTARVIDSGASDPAQASLLAARVRCIVADAAEQTLTRVGHALGPAPLALDAEHARRVADLQLYLRQHHAERDQAALGALLVKSTEQPW